ncbi:MAG: hypothetical protein Q8L86_06735 [Vicinamibacterales bacterium]|nr:hypothetical protein [Vicinamibacterales bacterium]
MPRLTQARPTASTLVVAAAATAFICSIAALAAQGGQAAPAARAGQPPAGNQTAPAPPPPPKPLVPVTASSVIAAPDRYLGETVTLTGIVDKAMSITTFTVDHDAKTSSDKSILVIARRTLNEPVVADEYVTVIGELIKYDPAEVAKRKDPAFVSDVPAETLAAFAGRPVVLATTVFQGSRDLAMRLPPPMTPAEEALDKAMKAVGPANGAFRKGMAGSNVELAAKNAAILREAFVESEQFFKAQRMREPERWAVDARRIVESIQKAVAANNWTAVKAEADNLGKACQTCHAAYRDRYDDGSFRLIRPGGQ